MPRFRLITHHLCPYVQRALIVAKERGIAVERNDIDLANKPDWFLRLSPTGKTPLLLVGEENQYSRVFESAVIAEYFDEVGSGSSLLPSDPLERARARSWVEYASTILNIVGQLYSAPTEAGFRQASNSLRIHLGRLESEIASPWFAGGEFGLVDAAFAPVFRYFAVFSEAADWNPVREFPVIDAWQKRLLGRPSVRAAVSDSYAQDLVDFVRRKDSWLGSLFAAEESAVA